MENEKFQKGVVTWPEIRNIIYIASGVVAIVLYINNISSKIDVTNDQLVTINSRLSAHSTKLNDLATDYQLANDRLTKIETTLQINQQEGRISYAKPTNPSISPEIAETSPVAAGSAQPSTQTDKTTNPQPQNVTYNNVYQFSPTPTPQTVIAPMPTNTPTPPPQPQSGIITGVLSALGL